MQQKIIFVYSIKKASHLIGTLPVTTATVEKTFGSIKRLKKQVSSTCRKRGHVGRSAI